MNITLVEIYNFAAEFASPFRAWNRSTFPLRISVENGSDRNNHTTHYLVRTTFNRWFALGRSEVALDIVACGSYSLLVGFYVCFWLLRLLANSSCSERMGFNMKL